MSKKLATGKPSAHLLDVPSPCITLVIAYLDPQSFYSLSVTSRVFANIKDEEIVRKFLIPKWIESIAKLNARETIWFENRINLVSLFFAQSQICVFCMKPCIGRCVRGAFGHEACVNGLKRIKFSRVKSLYANSMGLMPIGTTLATDEQGREAYPNSANEEYECLSLKMMATKAENEAWRRLLRNEDKKSIRLAKSTYNFRSLIRRNEQTITKQTTCADTAFKRISDYYDALFQFDKWASSRYGDDYTKNFQYTGGALVQRTYMYDRAKFADAHFMRIIAKMFPY